MESHGSRDTKYPGIARTIPASPVRQLATPRILSTMAGDNLGTSSYVILGCPMYPGMSPSRTSCGSIGHSSIKLCVCILALSLLYRIVSNLKGLKAGLLCFYLTWLGIARVCTQVGRRPYCRVALLHIGLTTI